MEDPQPKHWDRSFEWVSYILFAIVGLVLLSLSPSILGLLALVLVAAVALIPVGLIAVIGYSLWRLFFSKA